MTEFHSIEEFPVMTPYGMAVCFGVFPNDNCEWATFNERTGELWWFANRHIRRRCNATNGAPGYSPFSNLNRVHLTHIERYVKSGWLPSGYDPLKTETWPL